MTNGVATGIDQRISQWRRSEFSRAHLGKPGGGWALSELLENRRWCRRLWPFPHVIAQQVFQESFYMRLAEEFTRQLKHPSSRFNRNMPGYDAEGLVLERDGPGPFSLFVSRPWHDMIASLMGVHAITGDVVGALHHHAPGSANGLVHNDLNPGFFIDARRDDGINVSDSGLCSYTTGATSVMGEEPRETVRAVAILFYVNNPDWRPGDGGETGLYRRISDPVDRPVARIPPINNSLLCFECTPTSFHSFISNRCKPRNSLSMWLHRPKSDVVNRWGEQQIVMWRA